MLDIPAPSMIKATARRFSPGLGGGPEGVGEAEPGGR